MNLQIILLRRKQKMLGRSLKPFFYLAMMILVVGLACTALGGSEPAATQEPAPQATVEVTQEPEAPAEPTPTLGVEIPQGMVMNLQEVKSATIQIQAEGTFVYPDGVYYNAAGRGTGFIISPDGIAVTNNHVVTGAGLLKVWVGGDTTRVYNARVLGVSECSDLAVIDIEGDGFPYMAWYQGAITVGLEVYAAGYPLGDPEFTLTKGIISKERANGDSSWASLSYALEHDATINPGNSGGPLVSAGGAVVGVNYAGNSGTNQYFAIGRDLARDVVDQLKEGKDLDSIGVNGEAFITESGSSGIWVYSVKSGSPAGKAGLKGGDIITQLEGLLLGRDGTMSDYCSILRTHQATDTLSISALNFFSGDYLEGEINGRELVVVGNVGNFGDDQTGGDGGFVTVTNDEGTIQMDVPADWYFDGTNWSTDWGTISFTASSIAVSPDLDGYYADDWNVPGVFFAASKGMARIGGYVQLLDGTDTWYEDACNLLGTYRYEDSLYEGSYRLWERCDGTGNLVLILAARPISDPLAYLMLVEIRMVTTDHYVVRDAALDSFIVIGNVP
jgi:serine protease Do